MARCQTCCRNCVLSTKKQKCMLFVPPQISLSAFLFKTLFQEAFIIVANISKLNGLDIKNSPGPFKIGLRPDID